MKMNYFMRFLYITQVSHSYIKVVKTQTMEIPYENYWKTLEISVQKSGEILS